MISSRMARFVPPRRFVSVMNGTSGCPPCKRNMPESDHPPKAPFTIAGEPDNHWRPLPNGRSYINVELKLCLMSNVEMARSSLREVPYDTCWPKVVGVVNVLVSGLASEAS